MKYRIDHEDFMDTYTKEEIQFFINNQKVTTETRLWLDGENKWKRIKEYDFDLSNAKFEPESGLPDYLPFSIRGLLSILDKGTLILVLFKWLYVLLAIFSLITPFIFYVWGVKMHILELDDKYVYSFYFMTFISLIISWMTFQLWIDRKSKINKLYNDGDEFVVTHLFAHVLQTTGEYFGIVIGVGGFFTYLLVYLLTKNENDYNMYQLGYFNSRVSLYIVFLYPFLGILIIGFFRVLAESIRALPAIANNTKKRKNHN